MNELDKFGQNLDFKVRRDQEKFHMSAASMSR